MSVSNTRFRAGRLRHAAAILAAVGLAACTAQDKPRTTTAAETGPSVTPAPAVTMTATPQVVQPGDSATLTWSSTSATSCAANGSWSGTQATANSSGIGTGALNTVGTYTYGLTCSGAGGSGTASVQIFVGAVSAPTVALTLTPSNIQPGDSATVTWSSTNATSCTASGGTGADGWSGTLATQSAGGMNIGAIKTAGEYAYTLTCAGPGGSGSASQILEVSSAAPPAPPAITFNAQPTVIQPGGSLTFSWNAANSTACTASGGSGADGWNGAQPAASTGKSVGPIATAGNYTYTLTCSGAGGTNSQSASVIVSASPLVPNVLVAVTASPQTVTAGNAAVLNWTSQNANSCVASGSWSGTQPTAGSAVSTGTLTTPGLYSYTLTCTGPGGSASSTAPVTVVAAPAAVTSFAATPQIVPAGQTFSLSWSTAGATACTAGGGTGSDSWTGAEPTASSGIAIGPIATAGVYTYTLTCTGPGGISVPGSATVTVTSGTVVPLPVVSVFAAVPTIIQAGQSTTFTWAAINATSCTASGGSGADNWSGTQPVASVATVIGPLNTVGTYTYTLACVGPGGTSSNSQVNVIVGAATPAPTIGQFSATPPFVQTGQSTTLTWATVNATSCAATGGTGSDGWAGTTQPAASIGTAIGPFTTAGTYPYTLTCTGPGGTTTPLSTTVTVSTTPPAPTITSFTVVPSAIQVGQTLAIAWNSSNATSCSGGGGASLDGWTSSSQPISSTGVTIGPINVAGTYTYTLTCTGTGGASSPSTAQVTVSASTPPASISVFAATPTSVTTGTQTASLSWNSANSTSCAGSGGNLADGWNLSTQPASSTGVTVGPFATAGTYSYTLSCTGAGGVSQPSTVTITAVAPTPAATVATFLATPSTIITGQSTLLSWSSANATSCTASGGAGNDGWSGAQSTANAAFPVGPITVAGTYTYTLTCTGPGGTGAAGNVTLTVNPAPTGAPTVTFTINNSSTANVQPGGSFTLRWAATNASTCVASGGTDSDGWSGTNQPILSIGTTLGPVSVPGIYTYTLTCTGTGGTGSASVTATVLSSSSQRCGLPSTQTVQLLSPAASVTSGVRGICLGCSVANPTHVTNSNLTDYATMNVVLGIAASTYVRVTDSTNTYPAGRLTGFLVADPSALLTLSLLQNVNVATYLNGTLQETATTSNLLTLQALGLLGNPQEGFVGFTTTKPFNAVEIDLGQLAAVLGSLNVYGSCVSLR